MTEIECITPPRERLPVIFVLETSFRMEGEKIDALNVAMCELQQQLEQLADSEGIKVHIGVLEFNTGCRWVNGEELVPVNELKWEILEAGGLMDLGAALEALDDVLSRQGKTLFRTSFSVYRPVIIFVTDGMSTDDYRPPLEAILQNKWYQRARKYAIALGEDVDAGILAQIVQSEESVFSADNCEQLVPLLVPEAMAYCVDRVWPENDEQLMPLLAPEVMARCVDRVWLEDDEPAPDPDGFSGAPGNEWDNEEWPVDEMESSPRPLLPVFFVLETSGSMEWNRIRALNVAMCELQQQLEQLADSEGIKVHIGVLEFNTGCRWVNGEELVPVNELKWEILEAGGLMDLGAALEALDDVLSRQGKTLFRTSFSVYRPMIIFVTDGMPTDDYRPPLEAILRNKWYQRARKYAIALGDDADAGILAQIVQSEESVFSADNCEQLMPLLVRQTMECCANSIQLGTAPLPDREENEK